MKKLALDMRALAPGFKSHALRGIGRYVRELEAELLKNESKNFSYKPIYEMATRESYFRSALSKVPLARGTIQTHISQPLALRKKEFDFIHFFAQCDAPVWGLKRPFFLTVHDLIPLKFPELYSSGPNCPKYKLARGLEISAIKSAKGIITISESTKKDIIHELGISADKIRVTHLAASGNLFEPVVNFESEAKKIKSSLEIPHDANVLSYVGGIDPRKNLKFLINLLENLVENYKSYSLKTPPFLMIIGAQKNEKEYNQFKKLISEKGLDSYVKETGYVKDEELALYYKLSDIFIFPSLYEGFGLPVLEAMAAGVTVIAGDNSAMPELSAGTREGERGVYLAGDSDLKEWSSLIAELLNSPEKTKAAGEKGSLRAKEFSWEKTARLTEEAWAEFAKIAG